MNSRLFSSISTYRNRISQATSLQTQASSSIPAAYRNRILSSSLKLKPYLSSNLKLNPQSTQDNAWPAEYDSPQSQLVETRSLKLKPQTKAEFIRLFSSSPVSINWISQTSNLKPQARSSSQFGTPWDLNGILKKTLWEHWQMNFIHVNEKWMMLTKFHTLWMKIE
jgi:hypothetical protein